MYKFQNFIQKYISFQSKMSSDSGSDFETPGSSKKRKAKKVKKSCTKKAKKMPENDPNKCFFCHQRLENVLFHENRPEGAVEECVALTNSSLNLETTTDEYDEDSRPELRATQVVFYCQEGHILPFDVDSEDRENGLEIYMDGFLKCLTDENPLGKPDYEFPK